MSLLKEIINIPLPKYSFRKATANEFDVLEDDGFRYELIDGVITLAPSPGFEHNEKNARIIIELGEFLKRNSIARLAVETDVRLNNLTVYRPDAIVILNKHAFIIENDRVIAAPDIVIEVLSESTKEKDLGKKADDYFKHGVSEYWIVDVEKKCIYFNIRSSQTWESSKIIDELHSTVLKGFVLDLKEIF